MCDESLSLLSNPDYLDSLGLDEIVRIIENMNITEKQKLIKLRERNSIVKQNIYESLGKKCGLLLAVRCEYLYTCIV